MTSILKKILIIAFVILVIWPFYYFANKDDKSPKYRLEKPFKGNIEEYVMSSGIIVPKEDVDIKSNVSGILQELYCKTGEKVKKGQILGLIEIVPEAVELSDAKSTFNSAKINFENYNNTYQRNKILYEKGIISKSDFESIESSYLDAKEKLRVSKEILSIISTGSIPSSKNSNIQIVSTINGVITDLPTEVGASVIRMNNFNEGTTIARVANIDDMVFEGTVKEYEVGKLTIGMPVKINSAINKAELSGQLYEISTSGKDVNGTIHFDVKCSVSELSHVKRTGYSANAKIIIHAKNDITLVKESWVAYRNDSTYVYLHKDTEKYEKRKISLGISNGILSEVKSEISVNDQLRVYE